MKHQLKTVTKRSFATLARRPYLKKSVRPSHQSESDPDLNVCLLCLKRLKTFVADAQVKVNRDGERVGFGDCFMAIGSQEEKDPLSEEVPEATASITFQGPVTPCKNKNKGDSSNVYLRFLTVAERHLQLEAANRFRNSVKGDGVMMRPPFCDNCFQSVQKLCNVFAEWESVRMTLQWRLGQISETIQQSHMKLPGNLEGMLLQLLSKQLKVHNPKLVNLLRKQLRLKCLREGQKLSNSPQVSVDRNSCLIAMEDKLTVPINKMLDFLKSLIVFFVFLVPENNEIFRIVKTEISFQQGEAPHHIKEEAKSAPTNYPFAIADNYADTEYGEDEDDGLGGVSDSDWELSKEDNVISETSPTPQRRSLRRRTNNMTIKYANSDSDSEVKSNVCSNLGDSETKFPCNLCNRQFITDASLRRHLKGHSVLPYSCKRCPKRFKKHMDMIAHKREAHSATSGGGITAPISSICTICQEVLPSKAKLIQHRRDVHKTSVGVTCEICGKCLPSKFAYDKHTELHNRRPHACTICRRFFSTEKGLKSHMSVIHVETMITSTEKQFKCEVPSCGKCFFSQSSFDVHASLHKTTFRCCICNTRCPDPSKMLRHLVKIHETTEVGISQYCLHCSNSFVLDQTLDLHKKVKHPYIAKLPCEVGTLCNAEFDTAEELREHLKIGHLPPDVVEIIEDLEESIPFIKTNTESGDNADAREKDIGLFTCKRCKWSFPSRSRLVLHQLVHTERDEKGLLNCLLCTEPFRQYIKYQEHFNKLHTPEVKPHSCSICKRQFIVKKTYAQHMRLHRVDATGGGGGKTDGANPEGGLTLKTISTVEFKCDECSESFKSKYPLLRHKHAVHGMEKPEKCTHEGCTKRFFTKCELKDHQLSHFEGQFQCHLCPMKLLRKKYLEEHILVHKQEKNYVCQFCGRGFVKRLGLDIHLDIHLGIKKYKCSYCDKAFCRKFARECHERTHTKEKPFLCKQCGKGFSQHISVKVHEKIHEKLNSSVIIRRPFRKTIAGEEDTSKAIKTNENLNKPEDSNSDDYEKEVKRRRGRPRNQTIVRVEHLEQSESHQDIEEFRPAFESLAPAPTDSAQVQMAAQPEASLSPLPTGTCFNTELGYLNQQQFFQ